MTYMYLFFSIILPVTLIAVVFCLPKILQWLNNYAGQKSAQIKMIDIYERNTLKFLRETSEETHPVLRDVITTSGHLMMSGSRLVRGILFTTNGSDNGSDALRKKEKHNPLIKQELKSLSADASKALEIAIANALLISTCQSTFFSIKLRSMVYLLLTEKRDKLKETQQIVYRFSEGKIAGSKFTKVRIPG